MNIEAFIAELVADWREHYCCDIDGADFQDALVKHGIFIERPATAKEAEEEWCQEFEIREGDLIMANSPAFSELLRRVRRDKAA